MSLRLPKSPHDVARQVANDEAISINQLITLALTEKVSALKTDQFCEERAKGSSWAKFERAMAQVAGRKSAEHDRLPSRRKS